MNKKYGIYLAKMEMIGHKITHSNTVMQFGYDCRKSAQQVADKCLKHLDRIHEMLYVFSYDDEERRDELEIGEPLPSDMANQL